ncbi:hypothetical protein TNCT_188441 [Trichonephila clavata]|uniref:Uncharacterized protein n=1 Tax=Trichonephila clavata TaxID=2740835 RepID=A0A8X6FIS4_TRICU|nr:hypothetical protein TNCT_188441 [Trichonephila clavata]
MAERFPSRTIAYGRRSTFSNREIRRRYMESGIKRRSCKNRAAEIGVNHKYETFFMKSSVIVMIGLLGASIMISHSFTTKLKEAYSDEKNVCLDNVIGVLHADSVEDSEWAVHAKVYATASMFGYHSIKSSASAMLQSGFTFSNVWVALYLADKNKDPDLMEAVENFLSENTNKTLSNDTWREEVYMNIQNNNDRIKMFLNPKNESILSLS